MIQSLQIYQATPDAAYQTTQFNDLPLLCQQSRETFLMAARYADTATIRSLMSYYAQIHTQYIKDLTLVGTSLPKLILPLVSSESYICIADLLKMCEVAECKLAAAYKHLNYTHVPHGSRNLIWQQYVEIRQCCHNLNTLFGVYHQL